MSKVGRYWVNKVRYTEGVVENGESGASDVASVLGEGAEVIFSDGVVTIKMPLGEVCFYAYGGDYTTSLGFECDIYE